MQWSLCLLALVLCVLCSVTPGARAEADWPQPRHDSSGTGATHIQTPDGRAPQSWRFEPSKHVWGYEPGMSVWSSAAVARVKGRAVVLVGSYDRNLYCLDAITGERLWRYTSGGGIYGAPVLWNGPNGPLVFFGSSDRLVYALDAELGQRRWIYSVQSWRPTIGGARLSAPTLGMVHGQPALFIGHWVWDKSLGRHLQAGGLTAVDVHSGKQIWTAALGDNQVSWPIYAEIADGGRVFVASENGTLSALEANTGRVLWTHTERNKTKASPAFYRVEGQPRVIVGSKHGIIRSLDARTGKISWSHRTGHWVDGSAAVTQLDGRPAVLVGSYDNRLYALDALTGRPLWSYRTVAGIHTSPAVIHASGKLKVLFGAWDHHLHCLDGEDGSLLWNAFTGRPLWDSIRLGDSVWASPSAALINGRAVVYYGSYGGPFYALPLAEAARLASRPRTNLRFWVTLPLVMLGAALIAVYLSRRERKHRAPRDL